MKKILWYDTETTGVTINCAIIQIAGIIDFDGEVKEEFTINVRPFRDSIIDANALAINHKTLDEIMQYQEPQVALNQFENIMSKYINKLDKSDKFIQAGHNVQFDFDKMMEFYIKNFNKYLGSWINYKRSFDTLKLFQALQVVEKVPLTENNKLATVAEALGVKLDIAHDALFDIRATREIGYKLMDLIR